MRSYHDRLLHERKTNSTMVTLSSRLSQSPGNLEGNCEEKGLKSHGSDACTETEFEDQPRFGVKIERKELQFSRAEEQNRATSEGTKATSVLPKRLLLTAGSPRTSSTVLPPRSTANPKKRTHKDHFSETMVWSEPATRAIPFIDFNSTVRTTVIHVEEAFSPSHILRPSVGGYAGLPPRTSPRTKRLSMPFHHHHAVRQSSMGPEGSQSPLLPEDRLEEGLPRRLQPDNRPLWKYRGLSLRTTAVFDIRPIVAWKKRMDLAFSPS